MSKTLRIRSFQSPGSSWSSSSSSSCTIVVTAVTSAIVSISIANNYHQNKNVGTTGTPGRPSLSLCEGRPHHQQQQQQQQEDKVNIKGETETTKLIFLGSGSSTGCPVGECLFSLPSQQKKLGSSSSTPSCRISHLASQGNPKENKNYRNNPSFLIQHYHQGSYRNIIIDVGKTFREGAIRWFPKFNVQSLDAIILTHEHMDAAAGLDDVRSFQPNQTLIVNGQLSKKRIPVPLYLSQHCHNILSNQFPFLLPPKSQGNSIVSSSTRQQPSDDKTPKVQRDVAGFDVHIFQDFQPTSINGIMDIIPLPVWHGEDLISYGYAFSVQRKDGTNVNVLYISDVSRVPEETMDFIQRRLPPTDILIVDTLRWHGKHPTHFSLDEAMELRGIIQPRMGTYLVGMSCESFPPHDEMVQYLKETYGNVTFAYDGLSIPL